MKPTVERIRNIEERLRRPMLLSPPAEPDPPPDSLEPVIELFADSKPKIVEEEVSRSKDEGNQEECRKLRDALKQADLKAERLLISTLLQNAKLKREDCRTRIANNKLRLGEYQIDRESGMKEVWVDGVSLRKIRERLALILKEKQLLDKKKKNLQKKPDVDETSEKKAIIGCQLMMLAKQEQQLQQELDILQEQKLAFNREFKRLYQQEHSKYGRPGEDGLVHWPTLAGNYQILQLIGKGGYSEVYRAFDIKELRQVACKIHELQSSWSDSSKENYIKHATRESQVHKQLNHPNIVRLFCTFHIDQSSMCTVLELCDGIDLGMYLKKAKIINQKEAKIMIRQVMNAIKYLHSRPQKVIHYDLKPQNILFHRGQVKVSDFGLCKIMKNESNSMDLTSQGVGTYWYLPPECFVVSDTPVKITPKVDIWSLGVIYFEMLYGKKPFGHQMSQMKILKERVILKSVKVQFPSKPVLTNQCKDFIQKCLSYSQSERMDIDQALGHIYFQKK